MVLFENAIFLVWTCYLTPPQQHHLAVDHSNASIQDSGQTLSDGSLLIAVIFSLLTLLEAHLTLLKTIF